MRFWEMMFECRVAGAIELNTEVSAKKAFRDAQRGGRVVDAGCSAYALRTPRLDVAKKWRMHGYMACFMISILQEPEKWLPSRLARQGILQL
jgi:hypothetical protein